jgi:hypothetical protein
VLRSCQSLDDIDDDDLSGMITNSIDTFGESLYKFDEDLPKYLRGGGNPKWIPMTCATVHISNIISSFNMDEEDTLCFMEHIHLLYRFDDFLEMAPQLYAIHDLSTISDTILDSFRVFDSSNSDSDLDDSGSLHDSPLEETTIKDLAGNSFLQHDMLDLIKLLHQSPVKDASQYNQRWYTAEMRELLKAMARQLLEGSDQTPRDSDRHLLLDTKNNFRLWLHSTGASSVGTRYQFAFLACLVSAKRRVPCWQGTEQQYLAQTFAQHISAGWRIWNDIGGQLRDKEEGAFTSCNFVETSDLESLTNIAKFEADCTMFAQQRFFELISCDQRVLSEKLEDWCCLEFFRTAVKLSGEIYTAGDPTRSRKGSLT